MKLPNEKPGISEMPGLFAANAAPFCHTTPSLTHFECAVKAAFPEFKPALPRVADNMVSQRHRFFFWWWFHCPLFFQFALHCERVNSVSAGDF